MAVKIIGSVPLKVLKSRIVRSRKVRFSKPLTFSFGAILTEAMKGCK